MKKIHTLADLQVQIMVLENEKFNRKAELVEELEKTCERLSPTNLVKRQVNKWTQGSVIGKDIMSAATAGLAGFVAKKLANADFMKSNPLKKIVGRFLPFLGGRSHEAEEEE